MPLCCDKFRTFILVTDEATSVVAKQQQQQQHEDEQVGVATVARVRVSSNWVTSLFMMIAVSMVT